MPKIEELQWMLPPDMKYTHNTFQRGGMDILEVHIQEWDKRLGVSSDKLIWFMGEDIPMLHREFKSGVHANIPFELGRARKEIEELFDSGKWRTYIPLPKEEQP